MQRNFATMGVLPPEGKAWTVDDVWSIDRAAGELPPWNPEGIALDPGDYATTADFNAAKMKMIDDSGYRKLYEESLKGPPTSQRREAHDYFEKKKWTGWLLAAGAVVAGLAFMS